MEENCNDKRGKGSSMVYMIRRSRRITVKVHYHHDDLDSLPFCMCLRWGVYVVCDEVRADG